MLDSLIAFQADEAEILYELPSPVVEADGLLGGLLAGMRRLHDMVNLR
ncbi:MAG: hypothetical protein WAM90_09690 [Rhodanobacter sp.]